MSKNNKAKKSVDPKLQGFGALSALLAPEPEQDVIEIALDALMEDPAFPVVDLATAKLNEAARLSVEADELEKLVLARKSRMGDVAIQQTSLQGSVLAFKAKLRKSLLESDMISNARALWQDQFSKNLDAAVEIGAKRSTSLQKLQDELTALVAEAEEIRTANESAAAQIETYRTLSNQCAKEAGELLASIQ